MPHSDRTDPADGFEPDPHAVEHAEAQERLWHIATETDWGEAQAAGEYRISTRGATLSQVGFVHCSFPRQAAGVAEFIYRDAVEPLIVLEIDRAQVRDVLRVEPGDPTQPDGPQFPHLYAPIPVSAVRAIRQAGFDADGGFVVGPAARP